MPDDIRSSLQNYEKILNETTKTDGTKQETKQENIDTKPNLLDNLLYSNQDTKLSTKLSELSTMPTKLSELSTKISIKQEESCKDSSNTKYTKLSELNQESLVKQQETGTALAEIEDETIKDLMGELDDEVKASIKLTPKEIKKLLRHVNKLKYGDHCSLPMVCGGTECVATKTCPLVEIGKEAIGKACPFEDYAMKQWLKDYQESLQSDLKDKIERSLIMDLVECDILNARANMALSSDGFMMTNPIAVDPNTGDVLNRREEHIALKLKDRAKERKDKILKMFVATRDQKMKQLQSLREDPSKLMAELRRKAQEVSDKHDQIDATIVTEIKDGNKNT